MRISMRQLVEKTNINTFHFICDKKFAGYEDDFWSFNYPKETKYGEVYFDLVQNTKVLTPRPEVLAKFIDKSNIFEFKSIEIDNNVMYIYLDRR